MGEGLLDCLDLVLEMPKVKGVTRAAVSAGRGEVAKTTAAGHRAVAVIVDEAVVGVRVMVRMCIPSGSTMTMLIT